MMFGQFILCDQLPNQQASKIPEAQEVTVKLNIQNTIPQKDILALLTFHHLFRVSFTASLSDMKAFSLTTSVQFQNSI